MHKPTTLIVKFIKIVFIASCGFCVIPVKAVELEEILVTATKRQRSSLDVSLSVTAFSSEQLKELGIDQAFEIAQQTPNLQMKSTFGLTSPQLFMRGVGNETFFTNAISPIGIYQDGVYLGQNIAQGFQVFDLERVEVLKGPQGTIFGRNTTGGSINYISRKPEIEEGANGHVTLTGGDFGQFDINAAAGFALGETAAVRLSLFRQEHDGYFTNVNPAVDEGDHGALETIAGRGQLYWEPTDNFDALLNFHIGDTDSQNRGYKAAYLDNCPAGVSPGAFQGGCTGPSFFIDTDFDFIPDTAVDLNFVSPPAFGLTDPPGFYDTALSVSTIEDVDTIGFSAEMNWDIGNHTITSVTGYDDAELFRYEDDEAGAAVISDSTFTADTYFWSQEIRITSDYSGPINWLAGFNYYKDNNDSFISFDTRENPDPFTFGQGVGIELDQATESWAVFGEVVYNFTERFELIAGLRLTSDEREVDVESFIYNAGALSFPGALFDGSANPEAAGGGPIDNAAARAAIVQPNIFFIPTNLVTRTNLREDWFEWSGQASLSYALNDQQRVYFTASRGFKGGEFDGGAAFDPASLNITDPEFVNAYEIGYKGSLLDGKLQLTAAVFFAEINDQIVQANDAGPIPRLTNAASSENLGVEVEAKFRPNKAWFFSFGGAYLDAEFKEFEFDPAIVAAATSPATDLTGNRATEAPEWTFNGMARYEQPLFNGLISIVGDLSWNAEREFASENTAGLQQGSYGLVNARASYLFHNESIELSIFVRNLFEEEYFIGAFDITDFASGFVYIPGDPRTFGGSVTYSW